MADRETPRDFNIDPRSKFLLAVGMDSASLTAHAIDQDSGELLWKFKTASGINSPPITYTHQGRQYVTVLSGIGGLWWNAAREQLKNVPQGGSVWTFALMPE